MWQTEDPKWDNFKSLCGKTNSNDVGKSKNSRHVVMKKTCLTSLISTNNMVVVHMAKHCYLNIPSGRSLPIEENLLIVVINKHSLSS